MGLARNPMSRPHAAEHAALVAVDLDGLSEEKPSEIRRRFGAIAEAPHETLGCLCWSARGHGLEPQF